MRCWGTVGDSGRVHTGHLLVCDCDPVTRVVGLSTFNSSLPLRTDLGSPQDLGYNVFLPRLTNNYNHRSPTTDATRASTESLQTFLSLPSVVLREVRHSRSCGDVNNEWHYLRPVKREAMGDIRVHNLVKELPLFRSGHFHLPSTSVLNKFCPNRPLCHDHPHLCIVLLHPIYRNRFIEHRYPLHASPPPHVSIRSSFCLGIRRRQIVRRLSPHTAGSRDQPVKRSSVITANAIVVLTDWKWAGATSGRSVIVVIWLDATASN